MPDTRPRADFLPSGTYDSRTARPALYLPPEQRWTFAPYRAAGCAIVLLCAAMGAWTFAWLALAIVRHWNGA